MHDMIRKKHVESLAVDTASGQEQKNHTYFVDYLLRTYSVCCFFFFFFNHRLFEETVTE